MVPATLKDISLGITIEYFDFILEVVQGIEIKIQNIYSQIVQAALSMKDQLKLRQDRELNKRKLNTRQTIHFGKKLLRLKNLVDQVFKGKWLIFCEKINLKSRTAEYAARLAKKDINPKYYIFGVDILDKIVTESKMYDVSDINKFISHNLSTPKAIKLLNTDEDEFKKLAKRSLQFHKAKRTLEKKKVKFTETWLKSACDTGYEFKGSVFKHLVALNNVGGQKAVDKCLNTIVLTGSYQQVPSKKQKSAKKVVDLETHFGIIITTIDSIEAGKIKHATVPDHILDKVVERAQYLKNNQ